MEDTVTQVLRDFGLKCVHAEKERAFFACRTDKGIKCLKKVNWGFENILFQNHVKELLVLNGFTDIDRFNLSVNGLPYAVLNGETYVLTDFTDGRDASFSSPAQFREIIKKIAEMHFICRDVDYKNPPAAKGDPPAIIYEKSVADLKRYKKFICKQSQLSDFDVTLLKNYDFYMDSLDAWYDIAKRDVCADLAEEAEKRQFICHNLIKEGNIFISNRNRVYITNFNEITVGHFMRELSAIIKRYIKYEPKEAVQLEEVVSIYDSQNPVGKDEILLLKACLIFPDKFLRICEKYYSKKRTWIPGTFVSRMESITGDSGFQHEYLSDFFK